MCISSVLANHLFILSFKLNVTTVGTRLLFFLPFFSFPEAIVRGGEGEGEITVVQSISIN